MQTLVRQNNWAASWPRTALGLAYSFFLTTAAGAAFYITNTYKAYINSDSATSNILADEIARTGHFFPKDWWYVNSDLWVVFKHVFVLPWALLGKNGFAAHASAVLVGSVIMLVAAYALLKQARCSTAQAVLGASVLCLGFSDYYLETVFGEAAYTWTASALFIVLALLLRIKKFANLQARSAVPVIGLFVLIYLVALANPARFFVFFIAPIIGALFLLWHKQALSANRQNLSLIVSRPVLICLGTCAAAFIFAFVSHKAFLAGLSNSAGASAAVLVPLENLPQTIGYALLGILNLLGVGWVPGIKIATISGVLVAAKFFLYPVLLVAPAIAISATDSNAAYEQRLLVFTGYIGLFLIGFLVCATTLQGSGPVSASYTTRYVVPFVLLILLSNLCVWQLQTRVVKLLICSALALAFAGSWAYFAPAKLRVLENQNNAANIGYSFRPGWRQQVEKRVAFTKSLVDAGLTIGYAPYWHSHPYTVLSKGALQIRPVHMDDGNLRPWLHLSSSSWYKAGYATGQVFLLVPKSERTTMLPGLLGACMTTPAKQFEVDDYLVLVYSSNPLLGYFNRSLDGDGPVCISATSRSQIGKFDQQKSTLNSPANKVQGYLHFGPYSLLESGDYTVQFDLSVTDAKDSPSEIGYVEVTADNGTRAISRQALTSGTEPRILKINIRDRAAQNVELKVYSTGVAEMSLSGIKVQKVR